jgi:hypothetical protein
MKSSTPAHHEQSASSHQPSGGNFNNLSKFKSLKLNKRAMVIIACVVATVGVISILASHALTASNGDFEAESISPLPAGVSIVSEASASGGRAIEYAANATATATTTTPAINAITVFARGTQCQGSPILIVKADNAAVATHSVTASRSTPN